MFVEIMVIIPEVMLGAGRHVEYIEPKSNIPRGLHLNFVTQPLCLIALCLTKLSVGFFLLRLTPSTTHSRVIWAIMTLTVLSWTGNFCSYMLGLRSSCTRLIICSDNLLSVPAAEFDMG
jgi:hypothetical protein